MELHGSPQKELGLGATFHGSRNLPNRKHEDVEMQGISQLTSNAFAELERSVVDAGAV
jgi:hypothetical protein